MNFFKRYIDYVNDNPKGYWFKRKVWGWGWTPVTRAGWLTTIVFIVLVIWNAMRLDAIEQSGGDVVVAAVSQTVALVVLLMVIAFWKGESPKWQWGFPKKKETEESTK